MAKSPMALVIGNSAYKSVLRLANAANDATLVGGMKAGFDAADIKLELNVWEMRKAVREFGGTARAAELVGISPRSSRPART